MEKNELKVGEKYLKLKVGDKYLNIAINVGDANITFAAFPDLEATTENKRPNFKGKNVAVWVNEKKEKQADVKVEDVL